MSYKPTPANLDDIILSDEIKGDIEVISKNIHEVWAKNRMENGWGYEKNDEEHPCFTDYDSLPEAEKDIDRATVTQTIKMLMYLGYEIKKGDGKNV